MRSWQRTLPCCSVCRHGRRPIVGKPRRKNKSSIIIRMLEIAAELPADKVDVLTKRLLAEQQGGSLKTSSPTTSPTHAKSTFTMQAQLTENGCYAPEINLERRLRA